MVYCRARAPPLAASRGRAASQGLRVCEGALRVCEGLLRVYEGQGVSGDFRVLGGKREEIPRAAQLSPLGLVRC